MKQHFCASDEAFADLEKRMSAILPVAAGQSLEEGELIVFTPMSDYLQQTNFRELSLRVCCFAQPMLGDALYEILSRGDAFHRETAIGIERSEKYRVALLNQTKLHLI